MGRRSCRVAWDVEMRACGIAARGGIGWFGLISITFTACICKHEEPAHHAGATSDSHQSPDDVCACVFGCRAWCCRPTRSTLNRSNATSEITKQAWFGCQEGLRAASINRGSRPAGGWWADRSRPRSHRSASYIRTACWLHQAQRIQTTQSKYPHPSTQLPQPCHPASAVPRRARGTCVCVRACACMNRRRPNPSHLPSPPFHATHPIPTNPLPKHKQLQQPLVGVELPAGRHSRHAAVGRPVPDQAADGGGRGEASSGRGGGAAKEAGCGGWGSGRTSAAGQGGGSGRRRREGGVGQGGGGRVGRGRC